MRRISVVGTSGAGKSTFAGVLARKLDIPHIELDGIYHQPGWTTLPEVEFVQRVDSATRGGSWVADGNYRVATMDGPVWARADTVIWLDPSDRTIMFQVMARTFRRTLGRQELWNGNRETFRGVLSRDPEKSIIRWAWVTRDTNRDRYHAAMLDPAYAHLDFIRLTSRRAATRLLEQLA